MPPKTKPSRKKTASPKKNPASRRTKPKSPHKKKDKNLYQPEIEYSAIPPISNIATQSRVTVPNAMEQRISPYFGEDAAEAVPVSKCTQLNLSKLRKIAREVNKEGQKPKITGYSSQKETAESLCDKLIKQNVLVLTGGIMTSKYD